MRPLRLASASVLFLLAAAPSVGLSAQTRGAGLEVRLPADSAELAHLSELIQTALQPPVRVGPVAGEFTRGRIYPFSPGGAPGAPATPGPAGASYLVVGVLDHEGSDASPWVLHPFGRGPTDGPSRVLAPGTDELEVIGIGDVFGNGSFVVVYCHATPGANAAPRMLAFSDGWSERDITGSTVWRCDGGDGGP